MYRVLIIGQKPLFTTGNPEEAVSFLESVKGYKERFWAIDQKDDVLAYTCEGEVERFD